MFREEPVWALIVAAGQSSRMEGQDKIFAPLAGVPLIAHTVERLLRVSSVDRVVLVLHRGRVEAGWSLAVQRGWPSYVHICSGGERRQDSVRLGLEQTSGDGWVLIHDGARPQIGEALILRGLEAAVPTGAAVPGIPVADTIKLVRQGVVRRTLPRQELRAIQTPQVFRLFLIRQAYQRYAQAEETFTDDAALLEALGWPVAVFPGDPDNLKVTVPADLRLVEDRWREEQER